MDHNTAQNDINRAVKAREIIENDLYNEAWNKIREELVQKWADTRDPGHRDELWRYYKLTVTLQEVFEELISTGEHARALLERENAFSHKIKYWLGDKYARNSSR